MLILYHCSGSQIDVFSVFLSYLLYLLIPRIPVLACFPTVLVVKARQPSFCYLKSIKLPTTSGALHSVWKPIQQQHQNSVQKGHCSVCNSMHSVRISEPFRWCTSQCRYANYPEQA